VRLEWLPVAVRNLDDQLDWIAARNPAAAIRMGNAVERAVARLVRHPHTGRPGRLEGTRELVANGTPFVIAYRIEGNAVVVLRLMHGAQRCPGTL
jgi:toxin ParE1/3/4